MYSILIFINLLLIKKSNIMVSIHIILGNMNMPEVWPKAWDVAT